MTYFDKEEFLAAVAYCWRGRESAQSRQLAEGLVQDVGLRSGVTSGKHLDPLTALIAKIFIDAGLPRTSIFFKKKVELPGYYRAEKKWDLVVVHENELVAAIELKSILGSYGNNLNNRAEEAIGNAKDLLDGFEEGMIGTRPPWLGYVFLMQDEEKSRRPVTVRESHFSVDKEFRGASYQRRAELLCRRLVQKRMYSAACFIISTGEEDAVQQPAPDMTFAKFVAGIRGRVGEVLA